MITSIHQLDPSKKYTYTDYLGWQLDEMVELIRGKIVRMSPAPNTRHERISSNFFLIIGGHLKNQKYQAFRAPFDVHLPAGEGETVVQPDICVVFDPDKLDMHGCNGAPGWIIEVLSRSTAHKDLTDKFELYEQAGVQEYWVVHPEEGTLIIFQLDDNNRYQLRRLNPFTKQEAVTVGVLPDLTVNLGEVFTS
ncbi:MAG: Uma2 family endonuclease [Phaeodactylibacter sp.]|uniref:Uma2 family endonuclease n=1 Tax=Phaeodactylibacter sp. TaxID=1940289 RepID=UPI0032EC3B0C